LGGELRRARALPRGRDRRSAVGARERARVKILYHHRTQAEDGQAVHIRALQAAFLELGHQVEEVSLVRRGAQSAPQGSGARHAAPESNAPPAALGSSSQPAAPRRWGALTRLPRPLRELAEYAYSAQARRSITRAARRFGADFVYERYAFGNFGGLQAAHDLGLPLVLEVNSPMVDELLATRGLSWPGLARKVERRIFAGADLVCPVTAVLGEMLVELGAVRERLLVLPNGVDLRAYAEPGDAHARQQAEQLLGLAPARPGVLRAGFVGYYRPWHRLELAVAALARPALAEVELAIVGEGPARAEIEAAARAAGVASRVHFCGALPHARVPSCLPAFDLALVPAINPYASPLKLHEYMAAGLAVIAPNQPNLREVLVDGETALLFEPGSAEGLARAFERLVRDADARTRIGRSARQAVIDLELSWQGNARRVIEAVQRLPRRSAR